MSSDMNLSSILQSEMFCTPTQLIVVDVCLGSKSVKALLTEFGREDTQFVDFIELQHQGSIDHLGEEAQKVEARRLYSAVFRPFLLSSMLAHFERRLAQGTKERCVIIVFGLSDNILSATCLRELPIDASNLWFWKTSHLPGIIRIATLTPTLSSKKTSKRSNNSDMSSFQQLLEPIRAQYFETPRFDNSGTSQTDTTAESPKRFNYDKSRSNPYDILLCGRSFEDGASKWFREILRLHKAETGHASAHVSTQYGSGGSLYLLQGRLVSSVSGWRRVDWLVLAQCQFLPRLWNLDDSNILAELMQLFDYRHWLTRFDGLDATDEAVKGFVDYPDSDAESVFAALDEQKKNLAKEGNPEASQLSNSTSKKMGASKSSSSLSSTKSKSASPQASSSSTTSSNTTSNPPTSFNRRKREADWDNLHISDSLDSVQLVKQVSTLQSKSNSSHTSISSALSSATTMKAKKPTISEGESNLFRITDGHFVVWRELIISLNKEAWYKESLDVIHRYARSSLSSEAVPVDFDKLEGVALLGLGRKEDAVAKLSKYRDHLEEEEKDKRLLGLNTSVNSSLSVHEDDISGENDERMNTKVLEKARKEEASRTWAEVAAVYSACGEYISAQSSATKSLRLDHSNLSAQRTLVMAVVRTGTSSFEEEDFIFSFFALNSKSAQLQAQEASEYYQKRVTKHPLSGHFWYGYAMFTFVLARDMQAAGPIFQKALNLLPDQPRIAESFATFLFQSRSPLISKIKALYEDALRLDPSNLITRANAAAFFLFFHSAQLAHADAIQASKSVGADPWRFKEGDFASPSQNRSKSTKGRVAPSTATFASDLLNNEEVKYEVDQTALVSKRSELMEGFDRAQSILESVLFSASLLDQHPQVYLECWFYVVCYTVEAERAMQALQYLKAALRKGIRARNWDMAMHARFLAVREEHALPASEWSWILKLLEVIGDRQPLETLDKWVFWSKLKSDRLVRNLLLTTTQSFRVCVSPSKRREHMEDISPSTSSSSSTSGKKKRRDFSPIPLPAELSSSNSAAAKLRNSSAESESLKTPPTSMRRGKTFGGISKIGAKTSSTLGAASRGVSTKTPSSSASSPSTREMGTPGFAGEEDEEGVLTMLDTPKITPKHPKHKSYSTGTRISTTTITPTTASSSFSSKGDVATPTLSLDFFTSISDEEHEEDKDKKKAPTSKPIAFSSKTPPTLSRAASATGGISLLKAKGASSAPSKSRANTRRTSSSVKSSTNSKSPPASTPESQDQIWKSMLDKYKDPDVQYTEVVEEDAPRSSSAFVEQQQQQRSLSSPMDLTTTTASSGPTSHKREVSSSASARRKAADAPSTAIHDVPSRPKRATSELAPITRSKRQKAE